MDCKNMREFVIKFVLPFFCGVILAKCLNVYIDYPTPVNVVAANNEQVVSNKSDRSTDELAKVQTEFQKIQSREDRETIYKIFVGSAEFLNKTNTVVATSQFDPILARVQSSYSWDRGRYEALTDAVSDYLISVGYDKPKELRTRQERSDFAKIFADLAEVTKNE